MLWILLQDQKSLLICKLKAGSVELRQELQVELLSYKLLSAIRICHLPVAAAVVTGVFWHNFKLDIKPLAYNANATYLANKLAG